MPPSRWLKQQGTGELAAHLEATHVNPALTTLPPALYPTEAVQACGSMLRARGKQTTFEALQQPVEAYCGRRFRVEYLQQVKALLPDAFQWRHVMVPSGRNGR